jgi:glycosyltransferase involved in cell wall biosynthesis
MPPPLVTILLPVHNGAEHLPETLRSILVQSLEDFELLIVDDASTDDSVAIAERIQDPRIRIIHSQKRVKLSGVLNLGLNQAQGRYVARMDADDLCHPDRLLFQTRFMEEHPQVGICGTWIRYFGKAHHVLKRPLTHQEICAFTLFDSPFAHPTVFVRRELMERHALRFDGSFFPTEDFELWTRLLPLTQAINLPSILLEYRMHNQSLTGADWSNMDHQAGRVIRTQLGGIGITPTDDELRFHRHLTMGRLEMTAEWLDQAEQWYLHLIHANQATNRYDAEGLATVIGRFWTQTCMHSAKLGFWVATHYRHSPLSAYVPQRAQHSWLMRLASLKARLAK